MNNRCFCSFHQSPDKTKFPKKPLRKNVSRQSNSSSFVTHNYRLHFFDQNLNEKPFDCGNIVDGNIVDFGPCIGIWILRDIPNIANFNVSSRYH